MNNDEIYVVVIKRSWVDKNDDIITTGFSKTTKIEVDHIEIKEPEVTAIADTLSQKTIFEHFYIREKISKSWQQCHSIPYNCFPWKNGSVQNDIAQINCGFLERGNILL